MAQTRNEIQDEILQNIDNLAEIPAIEVLTENEQNTLPAFTSTSKVGVVRGFVFVFAVAAVSLQKLWDVFMDLVETLTKSSRQFTYPWYIKTALAYQHGYDLNSENKYDIPQTPAEIEAVNASKVIKKVDVVPTVLANVGALRIKVAIDNNGELGQASPEILAGFKYYMEKKGYAGALIETTSAEADDLKLHYKVYFNSLVLDNQGRRLDGQNDTPVQDAVKTYLKSNNINDFNGLLSLTKLDDVIQKVDGVEDPFRVYAASKYGAYSYENQDSNNTRGQIENYRRADSGYFKLDEGNTIWEFIPY